MTRSDRTDQGQNIDKYHSTMAPSGVWCQINHNAMVILVTPTQMTKQNTFRNNTIVKLRL